MPRYIVYIESAKRNCAIIQSRQVFFIWWIYIFLKQLNAIKGVIEYFVRYWGYIILSIFDFGYNLWPFPEVIGGLLLNQHSTCRSFSSICKVSIKPSLLFCIKHVYDMIYMISVTVALSNRALVLNITDTRTHSSLRS